ncbi:SNF2-related protein [Lentisphaerota bacterium WC36G]|nr:DEAD/DEAH box helicase [Lentisphaerae bacterium WC36]
MNYTIKLTTEKKIEFKNINENSNKKILNIKSKFEKTFASGFYALFCTNDTTLLNDELKYFHNFSHEVVKKILRSISSKDNIANFVYEEKFWNKNNLTSWLKKSPFFEGKEHLSEDFLREITEKFIIFLITRFKNYESEQFNFKDFINKVTNDKYIDIGKIMFHFAENKHLNKNEFPFVFIATVIDNTKNKINKHIPLSVALEKFVENKSKLIELLKPLSKVSIESEFLQELIASKKIYKPMYLNSDMAYNFLCLSELLDQYNIALKFPDIWKKKRPKRVSLEVNFSLNSCSEKNDNKVGFNSMLKFSLKRCLGKLSLTDEEFSQILEQSKNTNLIQFKGEWIIVEPEKIAELTSNWDKLRKINSQGIPFFTGLRLIANSQANKFLNTKQATDNNIYNDCESLSAKYNENINLTFDDKLKDILNNINASELDLSTLPRNIEQTIRHYQRDGVKWLWKMSQLGLGCCLADDMGLGKTLQVLTFLELQRLQFKNKNKYSLLIVPASLLKNWQNEGQKFTPHLKMKIFHAMELTAEQKEIVTNDPEYFIQKNNLSCIITTYQMLQRMPKLHKINWQNIIIDEAQAIKNPNSIQSKTVRNLSGKFKIALTGTPIENSVFDLWSLFDFINPTLLGDENSFKNYLKELNNQANLKPANNQLIDYSKLSTITTPFIMRRLKTNKAIISDLPDKSEVNVYCSLEKKQLQLYQRAVKSLAIELQESQKKNSEFDIDQSKDSHNYIDKNDDKNNQRNGLIFKYLMAFKQICNHPAHFTGSDNYALNESGKFIQLAKIAQKIAERSEKVLVFTQFKEMIEPIYEVLAPIFESEGLILHGGTTVKDRAKLVEKFQNDKNISFFVLSLKAAGTGLNLTSANHVIHFDRWWNPAVENQATDRAYRIGQHRNVLVHKFVTENSIEERIAELIDQKSTMAENLFSYSAEKLLADMNNDELINFISNQN